VVGATSSAGILVCGCIFQSPTLEDAEDDPLLARQRSQKQQKKTESSDTATIKKLHVSSANLQRVSCAGLFVAVVECFEIIDLELVANRCSSHFSNTTSAHIFNSVPLSARPP